MAYNKQKHVKLNDLRFIKLIIYSNLGEVNLTVDSAHAVPANTSIESSIPVTSL